MKLSGFVKNALVDFESSVLQSPGKTVFFASLLSLVKSYKFLPLKWHCSAVNMKILMKKHGRFVQTAEIKKHFQII
jgi:hypothetical protein